MPAVRPSRQIGRAEGTFHSAARHSRLVRFLRFAIPAVILVIGGIIGAATFFSPIIKDVVPIDLSKFPFSPTKITMELPRVTGYTTDQRPYELTARAAVQDLTKLDVLELQEIKAKVELRDGQHVNVTAINGVYDTKAEVLRLNDHITIDSTSGYEGHLSEATVHISSGNIVSESPVEVRLPNGMLRANRLEIKENGASIKFGGGVEMDLKPEQFKQPAADDDPAAATVAPAPAVQAPAATAQASQHRGVAP